jgi:hypothetical protein
MCGGMALLSKCVHLSDVYELGRKDVDMKSFKYVTYNIGG